MKLHYPIRIGLCIVCLLFIPPYSQAQLTVSMKLGVKHSQVVMLQKILNQDSSTQVSSTGAGSPGNESDYFGLLTQKAVMKFQSKYAPEVLFPLGIYSPTGIVGPSSMKKLNSIAEGKLVEPQISVSPSEIPSTIRALVPKPVATSTVSFSSDYLKALEFQKIIQTKSRPILFTISKYQAMRGDTVSIVGNGFLSTGNTVYIGKNYPITQIASSNGTEIQFVIPDTVPSDSYTVWVENKNGSTFNAASSKFFSVTDNPKQAPTVQSITPSTILYSDDALVTITGTSFHPVQNALYSAFGVVKDISANGDTMQVPLRSFPGLYELSKNRNRVKGQSVQVFVIVQNIYGYSSKSLGFLVQF